MNLSQIKKQFAEISPEIVQRMSEEETRQLVRLLKDIETVEQENSVNTYIPYKWQLKFHNDGLDCRQRLLMCANQVGKTVCGTVEDSYHLTGLYPDWWEGRRFNQPILLWACGQTNDKVRDTVQKKLFGNPFDPDKFGTGSVPKKCLDITRTAGKQNVKGAYQMVMVKHFTNGVFDGWSQCALKSYDSGYKTFTSEGVHVIHLDEEPPMDIMDQCMVRQITTKGVLYMTFTPEEGFTDVVLQFVNNLKPGQSLITAEWDDALHLSEEDKKLMYEALPPHKREMRSRGLPFMGEGLVFPIHESVITCEPFEIPAHFAVICGMDIGAWNHNTAGAWLAWDRDADVVYVYDVYKEQGKVPPIHAAAFNSRGRDITIVYPHDGEKAADRFGGTTIAQQYRELGCNMHYTHFTNPPSEGEKEGQGGNSVEAGLLAMYTRMETGQFKVFGHLKEWFKEFRTYHRKDGKVVRLNEDIMSATRYACQSLRFSEPKRRRAVVSAPYSQKRFNPLAASLN